jgi:hypothetical protein
MIIEMRRSVLYSILGIFVVLIVGSVYGTPFFNKEKSTIDEQTQNLEVRFALLSGAKTNACSGPGFIDDKQDGDRLQGSCCSPMDFHRYTEQVEGLKEYAYIDKIPKDPYDISSELAKDLLGYQKDLQLTSEQQKVFDEAVGLSPGGGPCCCKCWRWFAFEGLTKYLIINHNFESEEIAELWELIDGCGGKGHVDDSGGVHH